MNWIDLENATSSRLIDWTATTTKLRPRRCLKVLGSPRISKEE